MKKNILPILLVAAGSTFGQAGSGYIAGGSNLAFSEATATMANNPANLGIHKSQVQLWGLNRFTKTQLVFGGISAQMKWKNTAAGINTHYSGTEFFNRSKVEMSIGQQFSSQFTAGISLGYNKIFQAFSYASTAFLNAKIGFRAQVLPKLILDAVISNPWTKKEALYQQYPRLDISFTYNLNAQCSLHPQCEISTNETSTFGLAFSQNIQDKVKLLACLKTGSEPISFGALFIQNKYSLQFATGYHQYLGFSPTVSFNWHVK